MSQSPMKESANELAEISVNTLHLRSHNKSNSKIQKFGNHFDKENLNANEAEEGSMMLPEKFGIKKPTSRRDYLAIKPTKLFGLMPTLKFTQLPYEIHFFSVMILEPKDVILKVRLLNRSFNNLVLSPVLWRFIEEAQCAKGT